MSTQQAHHSILSVIKHTPYHGRPHSMHMHLSDGVITGTPTDQFKHSNVNLLVRRKV